MGSAFVYSEEVDRIEFTGGDWVDIKKELSYGDSDELERTMISFQLNPNLITRSLKKGGKVEIGPEDLQQLEVNNGKIKLLELSIVDWSFKDRDGAKMDITQQSIMMLKKSIAKTLLQAIEDRNPEKKA